MDTTNDQDGFGGASLESGFESYKFFKMVQPDPKKGEEQTVLTLRLLPAMHSYRDKKQWKFFYCQHYGYCGNNPKNPEKPRARPFGCVGKKDRAGNVQVVCAKCVQVDKYFNRRKAREAELLAEHKIDEKSEAFRTIRKNDPELRKLSDWLQKHNNAKKFWINAMDQQGVFGVLQLSYTTCEKVLVPLLKKLQGEGYDAFDPNKGLWLNFIRSGQGINVKDTIEVATTPVDVPGVPGGKAFVYMAAPMTAEQKAKALKICPDLSKDVVKVITPEQVQQLVACSGDPNEVDRIWPQERSPGSGNAHDDEGSDDSAAENGALLLDGELSQAMSEIPAALPKVAVEDISEEELLRRLEEKRQAKAEAAKIAATPPATAGISAIPPGITIAGSTPPVMTTGTTVSSAADLIKRFSTPKQQ